MNVSDVGLPEGWARSASAPPERTAFDKIRDVLRRSPVSFSPEELDGAAGRLSRRGSLDSAVVLPLARSVGSGSSRSQQVAVHVDQGHVLLRVVAKYNDSPIGQKSRLRDQELAGILQQRKVAHPNIQQERWEEVEGHLRPVSELREGDLSVALVKSSLSNRSRINILTGLVRAVVHLHGKGICHGDLKPQNILLNTPGVCRGQAEREVELEDVCLTDFGEAKIFSEAKKTALVGLQQQEFCAPEKRERQGLSKRLEGDFEWQGLLSWLEGLNDPCFFDDGPGVADELAYEWTSPDARAIETDALFFDLQRLQDCLKILGCQPEVELLKQVLEARDETQAKALRQTWLEDESTCTALWTDLKKHWETLPPGLTEEQLQACDRYSLGVTAGLVLEVGIPKAAFEEKERAKRDPRRKVTALLAPAPLLQELDENDAPYAIAAKKLVLGLTRDEPLSRTPLEEALKQLEALALLCVPTEESLL